MESDPHAPGSREFDSRIPVDVEIDAIGFDSIRIYQRHHDIVDRLWSHFSLYSGLLILLALVSVAFRYSPPVKDLPLVLAFLPPVVYAVFFAGNHRALKLTVFELALLKSIAISKTRLRLMASPPGSMLLFHAAMAASCLIVYSASWFYILRGAAA